MLKCYDVATIITDEVTKEQNKEEVAELKSKLEEICTLIDDICERYNAKQMDFQVDPDTLHLMISMEFEGIWKDAE